MEHGGNKSGVHVEGMKTREARYSTSEGETSWNVDGMEYFYVSNKNAARREVENFRD